MPEALRITKYSDGKTFTIETDTPNCARCGSAINLRQSQPRYTTVDLKTFYCEACSYGENE